MTYTYQHYQGDYTITTLSPKSLPQYLLKRRRQGWNISIQLNCNHINQYVFWRERNYNQKMFSVNILRTCWQLMWLPVLWLITPLVHFALCSSFPSSAVVRSSSCLLIHHTCAQHYLTLPVSAPQCQIVCATSQLDFPKNLPVFFFFFASYLCVADLSLLTDLISACSSSLSLLLLIQVRDFGLRVDLDKIWMWI